MGTSFLMVSLPCPSRSCNAQEVEVEAQVVTTVTLHCHDCGYTWTVLGRRLPFLVVRRILASIPTQPEDAICDFGRESIRACTTDPQASLRR